MTDYNCIVFGCHQTKNVGDHLADAVDAGIPVILVNHATATNWNTSPDGRFRKEDYTPIQPGQNSGGQIQNLKVQEGEFEDFFEDFQMPHSLNLFSNVAYQKPGEEVVVAIKGTYSGQEQLILSIRVDKSALVMTLNTYVNDSYPHVYALLRKCIDICVNYAAYDDEFFDEQEKLFDLNEKKSDFSGCVDVVNNVNRVVDTAQRKIDMTLKHCDRQIERANEMIKKAKEKKANINLKLNR
eukprot:UN30559